MTNDEARATGISWKRMLLRKQDYRCCWCGLSIRKLGSNIEHIIPKSLGGTNDFVNLAVAHYTCNTERSSNMDIEPHPHQRFDFVRERIAAYKAGKVEPRDRPKFLEWRYDDGDLAGLW